MCVCVLGCGQSAQSWFNIRPYIVHGSNSVAGRWPWQVLIVNDVDNFICGGSLVDEFHVITAAHCIL